jgi:hypothetical protein
MTKRSVNLDRAAGALLAARPLNGYVRPRESMSRTDRELDKRLEVEKRIKTRVGHAEVYRSLPKPIREVLSKRFKAERKAGRLGDVSWNEWLPRQLEIIDGMQVQ